MCSDGLGRNQYRRVSKTSDLGGVAAMLAATAVFVIGDSFMKLVAEAVPPFEVLFVRGLAASAACASFTRWRAHTASIFFTRSRMALGAGS